MTSVHVAEPNCGVSLIHAPHVFDIVNPHSPTQVWTVSCRGVAVQPTGPKAVPKPKVLPPPRPKGKKW